MHAQRSRPRRETQVTTLQRFAIQIDVQPFRGLDLQPGQACTDGHRLQTKNAAGQQRPQGTHHILRRRHDAHVEQAVVYLRLRAEHMAAAGLAPVANAQGEEIPSQAKPGPPKRPNAECTSAKRLSPVRK